MTWPAIKIILVGILCAILCPQRALAVTECSVQVKSLFTGDEGSVWIFFTNGGGASITKADSDFEATTSFAVSALLASRPILVRYASDGVACSELRNDLIGLYLQ